MGRGPPDFSSLEYWQDRFSVETEFEWLAQSEALLPLISHQAAALVVEPESKSTTEIVDKEKRALRVLHFGCGSSNLGSDIQQVLKEEGISAKVVDADYVPPTSLSARDVPLIQLDVLDMKSLERVTEGQGGLWDVLVDKSTADAISCGPGVPRPKALSSSTNDSESIISNFDVNYTMDYSSSIIPPIEVLCSNLARVTRPGGRWISISYSSTRFNHLLNNTTNPSTPPSSAESLNISGAGSSGRSLPTWRIIEKIPLGSTSLPEGRTVKDVKGGTRVVYEPETPTWAYILERV